MGSTANSCQSYISINLLFYLFTFNECLVYKFMKFAEIMNYF